MLAVHPIKETGLASLQSSTFSWVAPRDRSHWVKERKSVPQLSLSTVGQGSIPWAQTKESPGLALTPTV